MILSLPLAVLTRAPASLQLDEHAMRAAVGQRGFDLPDALAQGFGGQVEMPVAVRRVS